MCCLEYQRAAPELQEKVVPASGHGPAARATLCGGLHFCLHAACVVVSAGNYPTNEVLCAGSCTSVLELPIVTDAGMPNLLNTCVPHDDTFS